MGQGKDFENILCDSLEDWVGDNGYVWVRRQTRKMRRGKFSMNQEVDVLCDSPYGEYYIGIEAKHRNTDNGLGFYFSSDLNIEQIEKGIEYAEISGRDYVVAVELRNYDGHDMTAWLVPPELFMWCYENEEKKVSWGQIEQYGYCIGYDRDYEITRSMVNSVVFVDSPDYLSMLDDLDDEKQ